METNRKIIFSEHSVSNKLKEKDLSKNRVYLKYTEIKKIKWSFVKRYTWKWAINSGIIVVERHRRTRVH